MAEESLDLKLCPSCSLRSLEFEGVEEPLYDKEKDMTFVRFKSVKCPLCNWRHDNW